MSKSKLESEHQFPPGFDKANQTPQQPQSMGSDRASDIIATDFNKGEPPASLLTHSGLISGQLNGYSNQLTKRKRGRPKKNRREETMLFQSTFLYTHPLFPSPRPPPSQDAHLTSTSINTSKKGKGIPHGSRNKNPYRKKDSSGSARYLLMSHIIMVNAEENVLEKIMAFSHHFSKSAFIISANGAISKVKISRFLSSGEAQTYEGRFEIQSLNDTMFNSENENQNNRFAGLNVILKSLSNGRIFGGRVVDVLIAASPIEVVLESFLSEGIEKLPTEGATSQPS